MIPKLSTTYESNLTPVQDAGLKRRGIGSYTWHTNLDTYERIVEDEVRKSAIAIAAAVYHLAMRDERLPRFSKEEMPARPAR